MGTDIHAFIEYDTTPDNDPPFRPTTKGLLDVRAFTTGELCIPRDYELFDALAFGRSAQISEGRHDGKRPLFRARGLPANLSDAVAQRYYHVVTDPDYTEKRFDPTDEFLGSLPDVSLEQARQWVEEGLAQWGPNEGDWQDGMSRDRVSNPDWHTTGWLSLKEIYRSLEHFDLDVRITSPEFQIALECMAGLERFFGPGHTRMVFWFDN